MLAYLLALGSTLAIETPIVSMVFLKQWRRMAIACAVTTSGTHLSMHFVLPRLVSDPLLLGEIIALLLESVVYWLMSRPRSLGRSLLASSLANSASYGFGFLLPLMLG